MRPPAGPSRWARNAPPRNRRGDRTSDGDRSWADADRSTAKLRRPAHADHENRGPAPILFGGAPAEKDGRRTAQPPAQRDRVEAHAEGGGNRIAAKARAFGSGAPAQFATLDQDPKIPQ